MVRAEFDKEVRRHEQLLTSEKQRPCSWPWPRAAKAQGDAAQKEARIAELQARLQAKASARTSSAWPTPSATRWRCGGDEGRAHAELERAWRRRSRLEAEKKLAVEQARSALERERDALPAQALGDAEKAAHASKSNWPSSSGKRRHHRLQGRRDRAPRT
ncbi:MAG: hypothetical protein ACLSVD_04585 [Eggerthellaceae bacterium]